MATWNTGPGRLKPGLEDDPDPRPQVLARRWVAKIQVGFKGLMTFSIWITRSILDGSIL